MVKGVALISWDIVEGGTISMKYPEDLEIPENTVQQIEISHNFSSSYIITEEADWNSISFYNEDKELIILLVLDKYDDGADFISLIDEFNKEIEAEQEKEQIKEQLRRIYTFSLDVFKTKDEVISKLSNDLAKTKVKLNDLEEKFKTIMNSDILEPKERLLFLFAMKDSLSFEKLKNLLDVSRKWLKKRLEKLQESEFILFDKENMKYQLNF
jgi:biotin operon repressor